MTLLIDGYNLLHASGIMGRGLGPGGLERARLALLNFLVESLEPAEVARTTIVFDAKQAPGNLGRESKQNGLTVRFASEYDSADELIEELIAADTSPRRLTVVSSDHRLHKAARRRRAMPIDSDQWHAQVLRARRERRQDSPEPDKPDGAASEFEVDFWLRHFGDGSK